jgi:uncharacterized glyoxalase superfamily protein PhnB
MFRRRPHDGAAETVAVSAARSHGRFMSRPRDREAVRANRSMPRSVVIPELVYEDVPRTIEWLCAAFGLVERWRVGVHRAQLGVGDAAIVIAQASRGQGFSPEERPGLRPPRPGEVTHGVMVRVEDVDRHFANAKAHGARILTPPTDYPYGERQYVAEDPAGHRWTFSQTVRDVAPEEWGGTSGNLD